MKLEGINPKWAIFISMKKILITMMVFGSFGVQEISAQSFWDQLADKGKEALEKGKQIIGKDSCRSYSDFTCAQLESSKYQVHVWLSPSKRGDDPTSLGMSYSLSSCSAKARNYAYDSNKKLDDYICCLVTKTSNCAEKHR